MTGKLKPPESGESPTEPTIDVFPYQGERADVSLPSRTAFGVLSSSDGTVGRPGETTCPSCSGETINGVGLFACTDCEWVGRLE
ncbi:hypothetical protein ACYJ1Y_04250 [Natrialbaceae archaeon A-gly3]